MTIKEIEKITKEKVYVSADGKEFKNEADCKEWENTYKFTIKQSFKKLPKVRVEGYVVAFPGANSDDCIVIMEPKSIDDIAIINAYIETFVYDGSMYARLDATYLNRKIVMNFGGDYGGDYESWDYFSCYTLEELREKYNRAQERIDLAFTKCEPAETAED